MLARVALVSSLLFALGAGLTVALSTDSLLGLLCAIALAFASGGFGGRLSLVLDQRNTLREIRAGRLKLF